LLQEEYSSLENHKTIVLSKLHELPGETLIDTLNLFGGSISIVYVDLALSASKLKRRLDLVWCEYYDAVQAYERTRSDIVDLTSAPISQCSHQLSVLSNSLQRSLKDRDSLYTEHRNLLSDFCVAKAKHEQVRRTIQRPILLYIEPLVGILESLDELMEKNRAASQNTQLQLSLSKATYQGVLMRLDEISREIHQSTAR
jgi:hypothetical protein